MALVCVMSRNYQTSKDNSQKNRRKAKSGPKPGKHHYDARIVSHKEKQIASGSQIVSRNRPGFNVHVPGYSKVELQNDSGRLFMSPQDSMRMAERYAKCLIFPYDNACMIPDGSLARSSLFRTKRTFTVAVPTDSTLAGDATGKFAFFVQPKIGDVGNPIQYQIGYVNLDTGFPVSLRQTKSYKENGASATSLALDTNATVLTQPKPSCLAIRTQTATSTGPPLTGWADFLPDGVSQFTFGTTYTVTDVSVGNGASLIIPTAPGSYIMTIQTATAANISTASPVTVTVETSIAGDPSVGSITILNASGVTSTKQATVYSLSLTPNDRIRIARNNTADTINTMTVFITPLFSPSYNLTENFGMIEKIRPVGMSVLASNQMSQYKVSGTIAASLVQPDSDDKIFADSKKWCSVDAISTFDKYYRGPLAKGAYVWWKPASDDDRRFYSVEDANSRQYPIILVAGEVAQEDVSNVSSMTPLVVTVEFVYEVCQSTQLFNQREFTGSQAIVDMTNQAVGRLSSITENPKHSSLLGDITKLMEQGAKFLPLLSLL